MKQLNTYITEGITKTSDSNNSLNIPVKAAVAISTSICGTLYDTLGFMDPFRFRTFTNTGEATQRVRDMLRKGKHIYKHLSCKAEVWDRINDLSVKNEFCTMTFEFIRKTNSGSNEWYDFDVIMIPDTDAIIKELEFYGGGYQDAQDSLGNVIEPGDIMLCMNLTSFKERRFIIAKVVKTTSNNRVVTDKGTFELGLCVVISKNGKSVDFSKVE